MGIGILWIDILEMDILGIDILAPIRLFVCLYVNFFFCQRFLNNYLT